MIRYCLLLLSLCLCLNSFSNEVCEGHYGQAKFNQGFTNIEDIITGIGIDILPESDLYQACARKLCGSPSEALSFLNSTHALDTSEANLAQSVPENVKETINRAIDSAHNCNQKILSRYTSEFINSRKQGFFTGIFHDSQGNWNDAVSVYRQFIKVDVDLSKDLESRLSFKVELPPELKSNLVFAKGINRFIESQRKLFTQDPLVDPARLGFFNDEPLHSREDLKVLEEFKAIGEDLDGAPRNQGSSSLTAETFNLCESTECQNGILDYQRRELEKLVDQARLMNNEQASKDQSQATCLASYIDSINTQKNEREIERAFPNAIEQFINKGMGNLSRKSRRDFKKYIDSHLKVSFSNNSAFQTDFMQSLESQIQEDKKCEIDSYNMTAIKNRFRLSSFTNVNPYASLKVCQGNANGDWVIGDQIDSILTDRRKNPVDIKLSISEFSCQHGHYGASTLAHELGHVLSVLISEDILSQESKAEHLKDRACTRSRNYAKNRSDQFFRHTSDTHFTEEDTADIIAARTYQDSDKLFNCKLLAQSIDSQEYGQLSLFPHRILPGSSTPFKDSHSSSFTRVIREAVDKNKPLPAECKEIIELSQSHTGFNSCLE